VQGADPFISIGSKKFYQSSLKALMVKKCRDNSIFFDNNH
jgi:hypothetical protein